MKVGGIRVGGTPPVYIRGSTRVLSGKGVLARNFHALFKSSVEGSDRGRLTR